MCKEETACLDLIFYKTRYNFEDLNHYHDEGGGGGLIKFLFINLFVYWSNLVTLLCFAAILLHYVPLKGTSVLMLFVIFDISVNW